MTVRSRSRWARRQRAYNVFSRLFPGLPDRGLERLVHLAVVYWLHPERYA